MSAEQPVTGTDAFESARQHFLAGLAALEAGEWARAETALEASLALLPGRPSTLLNLAAVRLRLGRPADALPLLDALLAQQPGDAEAWGHRGNALAALGRPAEALASFDRVLALVPTQPAALRQRALMLNALGRHAEALAPLDALLAARPGDAEALFLRGETLQAAGRPQDALAAYDQLLAAHPDIAAAWTQRGSILKDMGRAAEAAAAFRQALAHGGDAQLNGYFLASVSGAGGEAAPQAAPRAYVEGLFDSYAEEFDAHLVARLGYRTPQLLASLLPAGRRFASMLDLGCGTGLMAPLLDAVRATHGTPRGTHGTQGTAGTLDGVDLSSAMLAKARALASYRHLHHADVAEHLHATPERHDLVVAADVFVYVGALDAVFAGAARVLVPGGLFLFSVEEADAGQALQLRTSSRYAHGHEALRRLAAGQGFVERRAERATLRHDQQRPIGGLLLLLERV